MSFFRFAWDILPALANGLKVTLWLTAIGISIGTALGTFLALGKIYGNKPLRWLTGSYIELFRGTPLLVQLFILYYGLPAWGLRLSPELAAIIGLGLNSGAYSAEYFRGAIQSINEGQMTAARSMGLTKIKAIIYIILPQALRLAIPSWSNELIYLLKYTSLAYIINAPELMGQAKIIGAETFRYLEVFSVVALIYLVIVLILTRLLDRVENALKIPGFEIR
ncbi:MAG: amino acid ABC transporter permease [Candidatus Bipolaricaulota bacterium]|nr:amino acid ABC transporter permease [Candidatus Bipolaricaulota bacterium]MBS3791104.1 amino acid ABC transporter permease [Candidatus Bipolaricaulota bacterium]